MSTPFLMNFAGPLVHRLEQQGLLELAQGQQEQVVVFLANWLGTHARGGSLLGHVERALLACDEVEEVYFDLEQLKDVVQGLKEGH